jgi:hypothetical protein
MAMDLCQPNIVLPQRDDQLIHDLLHLDSVRLQLLNDWDEGAIVILTGFIAVFPFKLQDAPHVPWIVVDVLPSIMSLAANLLVFTALK